MSGERRYLSYAEAVEAYKQLRLTKEQHDALKKWSHLAKEYSADIEHDSRACPMCHFPHHGFISFNWPLAHPYLGKLVCCPMCWPPPLGDNPSAILPSMAQDEARKAEAAIQALGIRQTATTTARGRTR